MEQVFTRIAAWNQARYKQEYNHTLTMKLLQDEYQEWLTADTDANRVQELCDIMYVAFGAIWKLKIEPTQELVDVCARDVDSLDEASVLPVGTFISSYLSSLATAGKVNDHYKLRCLFTIVLLTQAELMAMGLTFDQTIQAMLILCDSNDSKPAKKTASNIKANEGPKDSNYISPIPSLQELLEQCENS